MNNKLTVPVVSAFVIGIGLTTFTFLFMDTDERVSTANVSEERRVLYWVAPMDPTYRRSEPGKSPMGMDLVPVYEETQSQTATEELNVVTVPSSMVQNLGIRTAPVEQRDLQRTIRTVGYVSADDNLISHVHVRAEGWIERLPVKAVGENVTKGQTLFELFAPEIHVTLGEFVQFLRRGDRAMLDVTLSRLNLLDISESEIQALRNGSPVKRRTAVLSPIDGVVLSLDVGEGMFVKPEMTTMVIADLSSVWVLVDIFEDQASWVKPGQEATLKLAYQPDVIRTGVVDYVYPTLNSKTRTLTARLKFPNPDSSLKPNMFADVQIQTEPVRNALVIPLEALIRTGLSERVVVSLGNGRFKSIEVRTGRENEQYIEIVEGLNSTDQVVISGQFLIDSESSLNAAVQRMEPNDPISTTPGAGP